MKVDLEDYSKVLDHVINVETHKAIQKDMFRMTQCGTELPNPIEMPIYVQDMREETIDVLIKSN